MFDKHISRRDFLSGMLAGVSMFVLGLIGCGKKEEQPVVKPEPETPEMTEEQKKEYVLNNCVCEKCPSFVKCEEDIGYCLHGKSKCITEKKGCICPDCPVTKKMGLKWGYYCTDGSAKELKAAEQM